MTLEQIISVVRKRAHLVDFRLMPYGIEIRRRDTPVIVHTTFWNNDLTLEQVDTAIRIHGIGDDNDHD